MDTPNSGADNGAAATKPSGGRKSLAPLFFVLFVPVVLLAAFGLNMRKNGIFTCPSSYDGGNYLLYCDGKAYADYDHGAFWYGLEPQAIEATKAADVLFIGNSRLELGFSSNALRDWFHAESARPYLLGFTHSENVTFTGPLLQKLNPHPKAYVINVDGFFTDKETPPGADVMHGGSTRARYDTKHAWQFFHAALCSHIGKLCGSTLAYYRDQADGVWRRGLVPPNQSPEKFWHALPLNQQEVALAQKVAPAFIASLGVRPECVILTYVPTTDNDIISARAIAAALGLKFVSPDYLQGLHTFDGSHLDPGSAERFAGAFLNEAKPALEACLGNHA